MIMLTETHLTPEVEDAEISIPGWILYRADRESRTHGGCAIYVRADLTSQLAMVHSNTYCDTIAVSVKTLDTLVVVNYRPPNSPYEKFAEALRVTQETINTTMKEESKVRNIFQVGDYNFPCISWPSGKIYSQERQTKSQEKKQAELLLEFADNNFLENKIETPTRGKNILDLAFVNNHAMINFYETIVNSSLTDHFTIQFSMNFSFKEEKEEKATNPYSTKVYEYNLRDADDEDWEKFEAILDALNYEEKSVNLSVEKKLEMLYKMLEDTTDIMMDKRKEFTNEEEWDDEEKRETKNFIPKKVRKLMRRKKKLSERMFSSKLWQRNLKVEEELEAVEKEIDDHYKERRSKEEKDAIGKMKDNPKYFYTYSRKFSKTKETIHSLVKEDGSVVTEAAEQAAMLMEQYTSVASTPMEAYMVPDPQQFFLVSEDEEAGGTAGPVTHGSNPVVSPVPAPTSEVEEVGEDNRQLVEEAIRRIHSQGGNPVLAQRPANPPTQEPTMEIFNFSPEDFMAAIDAIPAGASPGPDGIPAIILKKTKRTSSRILCDIFMQSMAEGTIPEILKSAFVIPVHKGGSRGKASNYRPISLTSHLMKVWERVIRASMVNYLELHGKLDPRQHGSRAGRSTLSQLLIHQDEILKALEEGANIDTIYLDFAKAYDKVDLGILLHKMKSLGISGKIGVWIHNFLLGRKQQVLLKGKKSKQEEMKSGVPQGSVLGPLMFLIYIGDISEGVTSSILVYVDDSKSSQKILSESDVEIHQRNLDEIYRWEKSNNMKLNGGKFLVLRYGKNQSIKENTMYFTSEMQHVIEQVNTCRDLGITMSDDATFSDQVEKVSRKAKQKCGWILRTFYCRKTNFLRSMFNTYVQPHMDYCSQLWAPSEGPQLDKIENVLRSFSAKIPQIKHMNYWERLQQLRMNSQQRRYERYKILYTWKALEGKVPECGIEEDTDPRHGRRCKIRPLKPKIRNLREQSFQISGPKLFNKMPKEIRNMSKCSQDDFKEALDSFLTRIPDEPPEPPEGPGAGAGGHY